MQPYFTGKWKRQYDTLIAQGQTSEAAANWVYARMDHASSSQAIKKLEKENAVLRATIKQLCLYGTT